jgi:hypothetical protein
MVINKVLTRKMISVYAALNTVIILRGASLSGRMLTILNL